MSSFLHVANGSCTTRLIESAGIPGVRSIWADPLYEGPVPAGLTDAELLEVRARYLSEPSDLERARGVRLQAEEIDPINDLRLWRAAIEHHESYEELILWFEHDLFDQLNLIQLLTWIRERVPRSKTVSLVCIGSFPGRPHFKGIGELTPLEIASLLDTRQAVDQTQYSLAERAWLAFREPTPVVLDDLRHTETSALPFLASALGRFLQEFPWTTDGLSRTERRLLQLAGTGPIDLLSAFPQMHQGEDAYYVTDLSLVAMADALSRTAPPLLTRAAGQNGNPTPLQGSVTLTDTGRAILARERDRVATCGIDRWLGGVHLQNGPTIWRWDPKTQRVTAT